MSTFFYLETVQDRPCRSFNIGQTSHRSKAPSQRCNLQVRRRSPWLEASGQKRLDTRSRFWTCKCLPRLQPLGRLPSARRRHKSTKTSKPLKQWASPPSFTNEAGRSKNLADRKAPRISLQQAFSPVIRRCVAFWGSQPLNQWRYRWRSFLSSKTWDLSGYWDLPPVFTCASHPQSVRTAEPAADRRYCPSRRGAVIERDVLYPKPIGSRYLLRISCKAPRSTIFWKYELTSVQPS